MTFQYSKHWTLSKALLAAVVSTAALSVAPAAFAAPRAQAPAAAPGTRASGTITAIAGNVLTVKDDKGAESKVTVADSARLLQLPAGSKSLSSATPMKLQDIAVGDRILAKITPDGVASTVVAMKQADVAVKQQHDREDWQTRGISGVIKSADPAAQTVTVATGSGATAKTLLVQISKTTVLRRYAPDSTKFDDAKPATLDQLKPGDQLRAKGDKNADGTQLAAEDIVAGTFHNIAGMVISVDAAAYTVTINDMATKKPFLVNISSDTQLHKLPPEMAQSMAMRLKGGGTGGPPAGGGATASAPGGAPQGSRPPSASSTASNSAGSPGQRGGDIQQVLNRAPILQLADLKKGDAVMVLTTEGQTPGAATAITLLAGVEPLLQASPNSSQSVLSASWNLGGGGAGQDAQ